MRGFRLLSNLFTEGFSFFFKKKRIKSITPRPELELLRLHPEMKIKYDQKLNSIKSTRRFVPREKEMKYLIKNGKYDEK